MLISCPVYYYLQAYVPEIFLLEASSEYLSSYPSSGAPSGRNSRHDTTRSGLGEFNPHKPVPPIRNSVQGSVRNGHGVPSTTGTQTGQCLIKNDLLENHMCGTKQADLRTPQR